MAEVSMTGGNTDFTSMIEQLFPMIMQIVQFVLTLKLFTTIISSFGGLL